MDREVLIQLLKDWKSAAATHGQPYVFVPTWAIEQVIKELSSIPVK
jgi:hypothetical protein